MSDNTSTTEPVLKTKFQQWQSDAFSAFDNLADSLLDDLDQIIKKMIETEDYSFTQKLTLLANYSGHGQPSRSFPFLDRDMFHQWLSGKCEPPKEDQESIIQLCLDNIRVTSQEASSFERVMCLLPITESFKSVKLFDTKTNEPSPYFDPWFPLDKFKWSVRTLRCLVNDRINFLGHLVLFCEEELLRIPNFGRKSLNEIKCTLEDQGLRLGIDFPGSKEFLEAVKAGKTGPDQ